MSGYSINLPFNTGGLYGVNVTRNTIASTVRIRSVDEGSAWDNLYSGVAASDAVASHSTGWKDTRLGVAELTFASNSASSFSGHVSEGGRFYVEDSNAGRRIKSISITKAADGSDVKDSVLTMSGGRYMITMPAYDVNISVESEALPVHSLVIEANTPDFTMNGVQQVDSYQSGSVYSSDAVNLRFSNDTCTSARANGYVTDRRSGSQKITITNYYKSGDYVWWTSVLAFTHDGKVTSFTGDSSGTQYLNITNVNFYKVENATLASVSPGVEKTMMVGRFRDDALYSYSLHFVNDRSTHSTMVSSWKVYKANSDGTSTGEEVTLTDGTNPLTFAGWGERAYLAARGTNSNTNKAIFNYNKFKMPAYDIVIDVAFGKTVSPCHIVQQIAGENGDYQPITENTDVTFTGTPRDEETHAFYEGDTVTVNKASNYIGYYKGTSDVSFTVNPPAGYVVSDVEYYLDYTPSTKRKDLTRSGNTFTIPNAALHSYSSGVGFGVNVRYSKFVPVTINQQVDETPLPGSDTKVGRVTLSTSNSGTFMDSSATGNPTTSFAAVLTKADSSVSASALASLGNKLSINVKLTDSTRVIGSVELMRTARVGTRWFPR